MRLANWFGLLCFFSGCPGMVGYDKQSVYWRCSICGKVDRAPPFPNGSQQDVAK